MYYQEWNDVVFLHWRVDHEELRKLVPKDLQIEKYNGESWVSLVAFTMEKVRLRNLPSFPSVSNFHEINFRTYVKFKGKQGVYFLSMECGSKISCLVAKVLSGLPYRYSRIIRNKGLCSSVNVKSKDKLYLKYEVGNQLTHKSGIDKWLTERYALFQDKDKAINEFNIHHVEWPLNKIKVSDLRLDYPKFNGLLNHSPEITHYSPGVKVIAWDKERNKKLGSAVFSENV